MPPVAPGCPISLSKTALTALSATLAALLCLSAATARADLFTTNGLHFRKGPAESGSDYGSGSQPDFRGPAYRGKVLMKRRDALQSVGAPDIGLSKACRKGQFGQVVDQRYVAILDQTIYGAAVGKRQSLYDPQRLGQQDIVYVFIGQGTTNCRVYPAGAFPG